MNDDYHNVVPVRRLTEGDREFYDEGDDFVEYYAAMNRNHTAYRYTPPDENGHDYLREFCKIHNAYPSRAPQLIPLTNRALFIVNKLNEMKLKYELDIFNDGGYSFSYDDAKLVNIIVEFKSPSDDAAITFSAHHDVSNIHSENAQDNSASVCNLLHLCKKLSKETTIKRRTLVVFTDKEECGGVGASRFAKQVKSGQYGEVDFNYVLELTGLGNAFWVDTKNELSAENSKAAKHLTDVFGEEKFHHTKTPFSDAMVLRRERLDAVCIGIVPKNDMKPGVFPSLWSICHSSTDKYDNTSERDMMDFTETLFQIVQGKTPVPVKEQDIATA